ncbi:MAG: hypothetical protein HOP15_08570, partial [Planctomycetes bacterium]|nr:hypothetical protein [Planctomycetota bacterium]
SEEAAPPRDSVRAAASSDGRALLVGREALFVFDAAAAQRGAEPWQRLAFELAPEEVVHATAIDARGRYWLATIEGLLVLEGERARRITQAQGLPDDWLRGLTFDRSGTLWLGSNQGGLTGLSEPGISTFRSAHERERMNLARVLQASDGRVYVSASDRGILRLEQDGLVPVPGSQVEPFRNVHVRFFQDRSGDWWLGGTAEVWRVRGPELELARAEAVGHEGGAGALGEFFQGADGRIWIGGSDQGLYALEPAADAPVFQRVLSAADLDGAFPRTLLAGHDGSTWIATNTALFRRRGGDLQRVQPRGALALEELEPRALLLDSRGWLWVGTRHAGLAYTREPGEKEPVFTRLSLKQGLPSDHVPALAEDEHGRIWIGTGRGLVRFDPENASLRLFTTADGLAGETVNHLIRDRNGVLWAAVAGGLSRLDPSVAPAPSLSPPVCIRRFEAGGRALPVPESGSVHLAGLELSPSERAVVVAYAGIDLAHGATLRFQHRLEGLDADWSESSAETSVSYGSLAPRSYRFLVRALTHDGVASTAPAVVEFRLAAPLWQRPWFLVALALALAGGLLGVQLLRAGRRHALERIRTQIATDLHDEVGAGLAQIAVLTEVARRVGAETSSARLGEVAELARATRSSMADLVWAIDPRRDTLRDLLQRLHGVTANLFGGAGLELVLRMPSEAELDGLALAPDRRRHLLLFFKEAAQNVARHARATRVEIELVVTSGRTGSRLRLTLQDDGRGFDPSVRTEGQGLASLRRRAQALGGELVLESAPGRGTRVELDVLL